MNRFTVFVFAVAIVGCLHQPGLAQAPESPQPSRVEPLMQLKLDRAKQILEALALEDYEQLARYARSMKLLSLESGWNVLQTDEYREQSRLFRRASEMIIDAAERKDIGRAALGYVSLSVRCVECHSYMRRENRPHGAGSGEVVPTTEE